MKNYIITFILALVFTAWVCDTHGPPKAAPIGISSVEGATNGKTVHDTQLADFFLTDQAKKTTYVNNVADDTPKPGRADFPMVGF
jgi:hypothetical protein